MKKQFIIFYVAAFCIVLGLSFAAPASSTILFYEDFEDELDVTLDPDRDWVGESHGTGSKALSSEQVRAGSKSYKFSCTGTINDLVRQEFCLRNLFTGGNSFHFPYGGEYWIGFSIFLAEGYENPSDPGGWGPIHHQYHCTVDGPPRCKWYEYGRTQNLRIHTEDGNWRSLVSWDAQQCSEEGEEPDKDWYTFDPYTVGKWTDFVIHIKWDYDDDGLTQIWKDGVLILDRSGGNCYNDLVGPYLKIGIYAHLDIGQTITVYYDELRIGDSSSSRSEVAPRGSVKLLPPMVYPPEKIIDK